jgi:hypothetical protein
MAGINPTESEERLIYKAPRQRRRAVKAAPATPVDPSVDSLTIIRPPTPKRSYSAVVGGAEPPGPPKLQKLGSAVPMNSITNPGAQPQASKPPARRPPRQGNPPRRGGPPVPRKASQNTTGFRVTEKWENKNWSKATFKPGTIISARHYEEHIDLSQNIPTSPTGLPRSPESLGPPQSPGSTAADSLCPFTDPRGGSVCRKQRCMVTIHAFDDHFVAVPIFSYGGKGLSEKPEGKKAEHLDIHDHRRADNITQNSLPTLRTRNMQPWFTALIPGSAVYYTYPVSVYYRRKVGLLGELTEVSTAQLINYYYNHAGRHHLPVPQQAATPADPIPEVDMTDP